MRKTVSLMKFYLICLTAKKKAVARTKIVVRQPFLYTAHFPHSSFFSRRFSARLVITWRMAAMGWR